MREKKKLNLRRCNSYAQPLQGHQGTLLLVGDGLATTTKESHQGAKGNDLMFGSLQNYFKNSYNKTGIA